ncbi:MAG: DsbA family protein [Rhizomicrobium sp.]
MSTLKIPVGSDDHGQGPADAAVTLVEYGDYQCPYCGQAFPIVKAVQKSFGKRLRLVFRNFPLSEMHEHAESAAEFAEFAGAHGKFWEAHDLLYENQDRLGGPLYLELAKSLDLPAAALRAALAEGTYRERVRADFMGGVKSGVNGTPSFFINGRRHDASFDFETLSDAINAAIGA